MASSSDLPLVSIVVPNYNYGQFVCEAVESALAQSYKAIEVIVVDDGSTDDSAKKLQRFGPRIQVISQSNQGLSAARNRGMQASRGELIAFLDADDLFHSGKISEQVSYLYRHEQVSLLATGVEQGEAPTWAGLSSRCDLSRSVPLTRNDLILRTQFLPSSVIMRTAVFRELGGFNPVLQAFEDREYWIRIAKRFGVAKLVAPWTFYRTQHVSMSHNVARLEKFERIVLAETFRDPLLKRDRCLKRRTYAYACALVVRDYRKQGKPFTALLRLAESFVHWPFHLEPVPSPLRNKRIKQAAFALMEGLRLRPRPDK